MPAQTVSGSLASTDNVVRPDGRLRQALPHLNLYFKMENPKGHRIEDLLADGAPIQPGRIYRAAMRGEQGVPRTSMHQSEEPISGDIGVESEQTDARLRGD